MSSTTSGYNTFTPVTAVPLTSTTTTTPILATGATSTPNMFTSYRTPQRYEQNALKWEQRGNYTKAQKNREKVWRLQNPQYGPTYAAPTFYDNQNRFLGYNAGLGQQGMQSTGFRHTVPPVVETHVHPTVVQQTMRPEKITEVQPVIHRDVEAPQVHVIEKHMYEQVRSTGPNFVTNQPIIEETVRPRIIEEIQPVVHREVPAPFVEHVEQHVTEHITQPTTMTKEILNDPTVRAPGFAAGGPIQQGIATQGGLGQQGLGQQGFQQGFQPGMQQGFGQQGLQQQGLQQQGLQQQGLQQQGLQQQGVPRNVNTNTNTNIRR